MEKQLDSVTKAKKQLIKLKYIEINIKSRCSVGNMTKDDVDLTSDCYYNNYPFTNFLSNYLYDNIFDPNPIERIISLNYKQEDYVYNLKLEDIPKSAFFSKKLKDFHFHNDIKCLIGDCHHIEYCEINEEENVVYKSDLYSASALRDGKAFKKLLLYLKTLMILKNANFQFLILLIFWKIFKSRSRLREIEALIIKEIQESVPYAKPKNLANYHEKIFDFLSNRYEYNSEFLDINKAYLGQNVENIYNLLLKENYNFGDKTQIDPIQNVFTFETYENLLKKFEKYGIKKLNLNIENRDKFILSWFDKFGPEYREYCIKLFGEDGKNYYDHANNWTNKIELIYLLQILFGSKYWVEDWDFYYPTEPDFFILPSWAKLKLENFEIFYFGGQEYGLFDEIISQFDSKKPVFDFNHITTPPMGRRCMNLANCIEKFYFYWMLTVKKIYYWFGHSNLYNNIYQGKYEILKYYFKQKLVKLEQDIFLRDGKDPEFYVSRSPRQIDLDKNVMESSMEELILYRDALNKYLKEIDHEFGFFRRFLENTNLYTQQEKELILQQHLIYSSDNDDKTEYYNEIARVDFRGYKSKKFIEIEGES
ncbi:hypothetical protein [Mesomycoplasma ovipneumoniae]|uniref:hypothetical protein n=1 Tax=Mesomycoplasma ovipneumoniae TaxID=29562 RepID=UPI0029622879|nr:hypothetical protein [Mesomycoplasma ovipneumoniae]